jgi:hypothetical protein
VLRRLSQVNSFFGVAEGWTLCPVRRAQDQKRLGTNRSVAISLMPRKDGTQKPVIFFTRAGAWRGVGGIVGLMNLLRIADQSG